MFDAGVDGIETSILTSVDKSVKFDLSGDNHVSKKVAPGAPVILRGTYHHLDYQSKQPSSNCAIPDPLKT